MKHLIDPMDLSVEEIQHLLELADDIILHKEKYQEVCRHKKLATLFFEPSTRTRLSFEAAMLELAAVYLVFLRQIPHRPPRARVFQIQSGSYPVTLISSPCAIRKKALRLWRLRKWTFRSSMPATADTIIRPRR